MARPTPLFWIGAFFGLLLGSFLVLLLGSHDTSETAEEYERRVGSRGRAAPDDEVHGGGGAGRGRQAPPDDQVHGGGRADRARQSLAKVHFMKKFVAALTEVPRNAHPNPAWRPLLREGAEPIRCADCHDPAKIDMERVKEQDPGAEAVQPFRQDIDFMADLMEKWVNRFNERHQERTGRAIGCTDCHAVDPRDKFQVYPPLMMSFVRALTSRPANGNPAPGWQPLLRDPESKAVLCALCHGELGTLMEENVDRLAKRRPEEYAGNRVFMIDLMERWVEEMNRKGGALLAKPLACTDCHESDPRKG